MGYTRRVRSLMPKAQRVVQAPVEFDGSVVICGDHRIRLEAYGVSLAIGNCTNEGLCSETVSLYEAENLILGLRAAIDKKRQEDVECIGGLSPFLRSLVEAEEQAILFGEGKGGKFDRTEKTCVAYEKCKVKYSEALESLGDSEDWKMDLHPEQFEIERKFMARYVKGDSNEVE